MKRLLFVPFLFLASSCGGFNLEFGGIRIQSGAQPDTRSRSVFGPSEENYQIIQPEVIPEIRYEQRSRTVRRRVAAPKAVLPPAATPCPTAYPVP